MSQSEKPFTVSDRRHFTPDGRLRDATGPEADAPADAEAGQAEAPQPAPPTEETPSPSGGEASEGGPAPPADFAQFVLSLGAQAGLLLSGQGLPEGVDPGEALQGARSIISILEMLRDKTEGRRTAREDEVLESLLFELRMAYVETSRASQS